MKPFRAISLGAGVQSSAVLLMALEGTIRADAAVFADTQSEPQAVYRHLWEVLAPRCIAAEFPLEIVSVGDLAEGVVSRRLPSHSDASRDFVPIPIFQLNSTGSHGMGRRQCTEEYKLKPIRRWLRQRVGPRGRATQLMGISLDEVQRMRDSPLGWIDYEYPLVDLRMTRWDCQRFLADRGIEAPRSACVFCPYRSNAEWRRLTAPEFAEAVRVDEAIRDQGARQGFLHPDRVPLRIVDLSTEEDHGQLSFLGECEGMCGV